MSVTGIATVGQNLSDPLIGQVIGQANETGTGTNAPGSGNAASPAVVEDVFTHSSQNGSDQAAQEAGIFRIGPGAAILGVTHNLFAQSFPNENQNSAPQPELPWSPSNAGAPQTVAANSGTSANANQQTAGAPTAQAVNSSAAAANVQLQIQSLNASLPTLGLTNIEINQIDRIAALVQNFNPAAYASLVNQFEALAQQAAPSSPTNAAVIPGTNAAANSVTNADVSSYQVQQISLTFLGAQQAAGDIGAADGGQGTSANNSQSNPGVQIARVQFTLTNGNGQTVHVQAP